MSKTIELLILILSLLTVTVNGCEYHICSNEYAELVSQVRVSEVHVTRDGSQASDDGRTSTATTGTKEQTEYCNLLNAYNQCMRTMNKPCRGNMNYHAIVAMVRKWLKESNCSGSFHKSRQGVRAQVSNVATIKREQELRRKEENLRKKLEVCFSDSLNYTFDPIGFINERKKIGGQYFKSTIKVIDDTFGNVNIGPDSLLNDDPHLFPSFASSAPKDGSSRQARSHDHDDSVLRSLPPTIMSSSAEDDSEDHLLSKSDDSLLCLLYGDPHLRTLKNEFMTCRCLGAWPLIDHPLFAVQVTNAKDDDARRSTISGITKVTVLVRRFTSCGIKHDLMYEADVSGQRQEDQVQQLPVSFIDGSINTPNNMVLISKTFSSFDGPEDEVCIEMRHINVSVCINQLIGNLMSPSPPSQHLFTTSLSGSTTTTTSQKKYLNVQIKFKSVNKLHKEAIIGSVSEFSLCKHGCPLRERIDIEGILDAAGFNLLDSLHIDGNNHNQADVSRNESLSSLLSDSFGKECEGLYGYYLLSCIFDVRMKGLSSTNVHKSSQMKEDSLDVTLIHKCYIEGQRKRLKSSSSSVRISSAASRSLLLITPILMYKLMY